MASAPISAPASAAPVSTACRAAAHSADSRSVARKISTTTATMNRWANMIRPPRAPHEPTIELTTSTATIPASQSSPEKVTILPFFPGGASSLISASETGRSAPMARPTATTPA